MKVDHEITSPYRKVKRPGTRLNISAHTAIAERVLGRRLPIGAQVHHVDGNGLNNAHNNLVICPSAAYHKLLHVRQAAVDATGNANALKCDTCNKFDDPKHITTTGRRQYHRACWAAYERGRKNAKANRRAA